MIKQNINISKNKPLSSSSYIKLPTVLIHSRKGLILIQNINDNKCLKCCLVGYLKMKTENHVIEFDQSKWLKPFIKFST